jgi:uncharacterized repeat protein (TIGR01451 family)
MGAVLCILLIPALAWCVPSGTVISNTAQATYNLGATVGIVSQSETVTTTTVIVRTPSALELLQYAPTVPGAELVSVPVTECSTTGTASGPFLPLPPPVPCGSSTPIDISNPVPLVSTNVYHQGESIFIRITDHDQNLDALVAETVLVSITTVSLGESELLRLTETGVSTGVFIGYIQSRCAIPASENDGICTVEAESQVVSRYTDSSDGTDTATATVMVDPYGIVFDSSTGLPVDGAQVTLIDITTGLPAQIFGEDGVSTFPATVTSGGTSTDSGGNIYDFPTGGYRFPFVTPGTYRLDVVPPSGYDSPSAVPTATLQTLPGGPFAIIEPGSRGEPFILNPGPAFNIDFPIDPVATSLWVTKTASQDTVSIGDFLQYIVNVQNTTAGVMSTITLTDLLPLGFRYQSGSLKINGIASPDPAISSDGRTLTLSLGNLAGNTTAAIRYIVEVAAGTRAGGATNGAVAKAAGGISSNVARVTVTVKEELFRSHCFIVGRVTPNGCHDTSDEDNGGVEGVRIYLEDGTYVVTDKRGMFHFEGVRPGVHVVQLDLDSLPEKYEVVPCEENSRFAGRSYSQFVDLQGGTLWRADFHVALKPRMNGEVGLHLQGSIKDDVVDYHVGLQGGGVPIRNLRLSVMLHESINYVNGSSRLGDAPLPDPEVNGNVLVYRIGDFHQGELKRNLSFKGVVSIQDDIRELITKCMLMFDTPTSNNQRTPLVESLLLLKSEEERLRQPDIVLSPRFETLSVQLQEEDLMLLNDVVKKLKELEIIHIYAVGHTDSRLIRPKNRHIFTDNYALSWGRARSVVRYFSQALGLAPSQITIVGKGPDEPVATNETPEGRALNRRVEFRIVTEKVTKKKSIEILKGKDSVSVETTGLLPGETWKTAEIETEKIETIQQAHRYKGKITCLTPDIGIRHYDKTWIESAEPGLEWLWPGPEYSPSIPSVKLAIKHNPRDTLKLLLDGSEVSPLNFDGTSQNKSRTVAVSRWRGVDLREGDNHFELIAYDRSGNKTGLLKRVVHYSGPPAHAEVVEEQSSLIADGRRTPVIVIRLTDRDGYPVREGMVGTFSVDAPYAAEEELDALQKNPLSGMDKEKPHYVVGKKGFALVRLQATSQSGEALVRVPLADDEEEELRVWLKPEARDWILVGLAEGTMGYNTVTGHMENAGEAHVDEDLYQNGRIAFFAKGRIKGEWLLTMAYDNKKTREKVGNSLHQTIDPDTYYTLYGDETQQKYDAASARKLYLKIERNQFYALFGDYDTGLTVTELSRYSRSLNGFKSEMKAKHYSFNLFASETNQAFVKDEIRGDGTSGLYNLSQKNIVINSEKIVIETRDRFRSEVVVSTRALTRHMDYNIDYDAGTLFFREPIYSKDENLNPVFIVVDYESYDATGEEYTYGGRGAVKLMDDKFEIGATYIHEGPTGARADLEGVDATLDVGKNTKLKAEFATSERVESGTEIDGDAYLAELTHRSGAFNGQVYMREQGTGFGLGQQKGSEAGTRKIGADASYRFSKEFNTRGELYRHFNLATDAERDLGQASVTYTGNRTTVHAGLRHAEDRLVDGTVNRSDQITAGAGRRMFGNRLQVRLDREQSLGSNNDNPDFPTRTILGTDYKLTESVILFGEQEFTQGENADTQGTRLGMKATPWSGGAVDTSVERQFTEYGPRAFANLGLRQTLNLNKKWGVDAGLDHSRTVDKPGSTPFNVNVPSSSGSNYDFTAVSMGTTYKEKSWSWTSRVEVRYAENEDKWGVTTGIYSEPASGIGLSAGIQLFRTEAESGSDATDADIRFGLAYRPKKTRWIILDRLDLKVDEKEDSNSNFENCRIINNMNANFKPDSKTQISLQYGLKYVMDTIDADHYSGYTDLMGVEGRYDLTKQWDVGLRSSVLHSWRSDEIDYSSGVSIGHNVVKNVWLSIGYNFLGFEDEDFSRADFTAQGPFIQFRFKFDQKSVRDALKGFVRYHEYGGRDPGGK